MAMRAATGDALAISAIASPHPSLLSTEVASKMTCPMLYLPAREDLKNMEGVVRDSHSSQITRTANIKLIDINT